MRFSKKLLAALLPITAASTLAPALSSCSKGNGYDINYGDEVNCIDEKATNYHSLDDIKNAVKKHVDIEQSPEVSLADLPMWTKDGSEMDKQSVFYDFIASLSGMEGIKFHLTLDKTAETNNFVITYLNDTTEVTAKGLIIDYFYDSVKTKKICIRLHNTVTSTDVTARSYKYQNSTIED